MIRCWLFGCEPHPQDPAPIEHLQCRRCGEVMQYSDLVGDTRWNRVKERATFWRDWFPERCFDCGKRYGKHKDCLPF